LLCPPVFYGYFHHPVGGEVPLLMPALVIKLVAHDGDGERLEVIFCLDILAHVPQPEHDFKAEDNLKALAITIMRNKFYDQCRHEERNFTTDKVMEVPIEDRRAEQRDEVNLIRQIVAQLPPLQQQIFRMKEIEGYTADEIMQITGCTADNLRKNLSRARLKIRETYMNIVKQNRTK
jgi:RNA polymerase sigma-70 factor (ECF subfamily)